MKFVTALADRIQSSPQRLAMPIGAYTGLAITGGTVRDIVSNAQAQVDSILALRERLNTSFLLTAMDLSAEAEAFGSTIVMSDTEIPTVIRRRVSKAGQVDALAVPIPGDARTCVHLEAARSLVACTQGSNLPVLGGMIGPFSLAGRLFGVCEALEATANEPAVIEALLAKVTPFLCDYARAFKRAGAQGIIVAEPAAGLLSPRSLARFSAPFIRTIVDAVQDESFAIILHNCGAKLVHLPQILQSGAELYHFGAPMDLPTALKQVGGRTILCGNLDPTAVFSQGTPEEVEAKTQDLLVSAGYARNFVISSGCDLPPGVPLENLEAFYRAVNADVPGQDEREVLSCSVGG